MSGLTETSGAHFVQDVSTSVTVEINLQNVASGTYDDIKGASGGDSNFAFELAFSDKDLETDPSGTKYGSVSGFVALGTRKQPLNAGSCLTRLSLFYDEGNLKFSPEHFPFLDILTRF